MRVTILGASDNPERYSYLVMKELEKNRIPSDLIHPKLTSIGGQRVFPHLGSLNPPLDILTLYVRPQILESLEEDILASRPRLVIFNPGTESMKLQDALRKSGIAYLEACSLVLLKTGQFLSLTKGA